MLKELRELREVENELIEYAEENGGEIHSETETRLETLRANVLARADRYLRYLKSGEFKKTLEYLKNKRKEISRAEKALERIKGYMIYCLSQVIPEEGFEVKDENGKTEFKASLTTTVSHVIEKDRVEPQYGRYILPAMDYTEYSLLKNAINSIPEEYRGTIEKLFEKAERKILISDLPEEHPALKKIEKLKIKFNKGGK